MTRSNTQKLLRHVAITGLALASLALSPLSHADEPRVLSGGYGYMCGLEKTEGTVRCWGTRTQSGVPSTTPASNLPYTALAMRDIVSLGAGASHACALRADGAVLCWGDNNTLAVGDADASKDILTPQIVNGLGAVTLSISSGSFADHHCAITSSFATKCWGYNSSGQLGNGNFTKTHIPQDVSGLGAASAVTTGRDHSCAVTLDGAVKCWGFGGYIGDGTGNARAAATQVLGLTTGVLDVAAGFQHTCALLVGGSVRCWGNGSKGQLGNGSTVGSNSPVAVLGVSDAVQLITGRDFSCALLGNGTVSCWGDRTTAGTPDGVVRAAPFIGSTPVTVAGLSGPVVSIGANYDYACAVVVSGAVECWGVHPTLLLSAEQRARATANLGGLALDTRLMMAEYRHASLDYFFLTSRYFEKLLLKAVVPDFQVTGKRFFVYPTGLLAGTKPITRYYFDKVAKRELRGSHFFTLVDAERAALNSLNPGNTAVPRLPYNEGVDSYAFTPLVEGVGGSCAAGQAPLYRAFRGARFPDDPNHRFTTDIALYNSLVVAGWDGEGVKMCVSP